MRVQYASRAAHLPERAQLRRWAKAAAQQAMDFTLRFVDEAEARAMNATYRHKDYATNVLTFIYASQPVLHGDIAICPRIVAREARAQGKPLKHHYAHLVTHGVLHLQGYDHENKKDAAQMEALEVALLARFRIPNPYGH